jgi:phosphatidylglycerol:prolipoprotein diacylglycerol transferase
MHPKLFTVGPFTIYSYGLMLGIGFIVASTVLTRELRRKGIDPNLGSTITLLAVFFGIAGSKLLYLIENWPSFARDPFGMAFSPGGLTWYGGFFLATVAIMVYVRRKKIPFLRICDAAAPALMIGYGIARLGCHFAGDGDYGMPTSLPWGAVYSNGTYPPSVAFRDFPDIVSRYGVNGVVPDTIAVHPAPVYEFILGIALFLLLWKLRTATSTRDGRLFMWYLILAGAARFGVEFIRLNPRLLFGLSEAQLISVVMIAAGTIGLRRLLPQLEEPLQR